MWENITKVDDTETGRGMNLSDRGQSPVAGTRFSIERRHFLKLRRVSAIELRIH